MALAPTSAFDDEAEERLEDVRGMMPGSSMPPMSADAEEEGEPGEIDAERVLARAAIAAIKADDPAALAQVFRDLKGM